MAKPYKMLRQLMYGEGINQEVLADYLLRGTTYVSLRMRGLATWSLKDVYRLCEMFDIPLDQISVYFPKEDTYKALGEK